ncbi:hypothetical protein KCG44_12050 [Pacificimonas sp. WHA3]|uniref:Uncharacterized protein n=1 Tax=Pacificimonas pallii TaxID=2827236 RepID=A0ABS6SGH8_9SPHN|nr:hypothetical protein [Pacificimonas pallii]MBV7257517.1 hypothetical protein [Pacificimonas pallii]
METQDDLSGFGQADDGSVPEAVTQSIVRAGVRMKRRVRTKSKQAVEVVLEDGTNLTGHIFVGVGERVLDCLNDTRSFFPFLAEDGAMLLLSKRTVAVCRPLDGAG